MSGKKKAGKGADKAKASKAEAKQVVAEKTSKSKADEKAAEPVVAAVAAVVPSTPAGAVKIMDNESESDKELEFENRAPKLDPYGPVGTKEQERSRVEVKASKIPAAGNGVFALFDFAKGDVISEFLGKKCKTRDEAYNGMMYAVEFTGDSGELILLDGYGFDNAAALANDALGRTRIPFLRNNARFTHYGDRMFLCAKRNIRKGEEIFVQYGHEYWQMEEDEYFEVNTTDQIIEKKLDTCH